MSNQIDFQLLSNSMVCTIFTGIVLLIITYIAVIRKRDIPLSYLFLFYGYISISVAFITRVFSDAISVSFFSMTIVHLLLSILCRLEEKQKGKEIKSMEKIKI